MNLDSILGILMLVGIATIAIIFAPVIIVILLFFLIANLI